MGTNEQLLKKATIIGFLLTTIIAAIFFLG
jgi:hypothetical protein